ncbi:2-keto-4-pentenoate hydratase [Ochrobactrum teleogrylli]
MQLEVARGLSEKIAGYKVSMTSGSPIAGIILGSTVQKSPGSWPKGSWLRAETEIAFIIGEHGPTKPGTVKLDEARRLVSGISSGIEILESRYLAQGRTHSLLERAADNLSNGAYVIGPVVKEWQTIDLLEQHLTMRVGKELLYNEKVHHPLREPLDCVAWLAGYLPKFGINLEPGQFVTTGSYTGAHAVIPGDEIRVTFGEIPEVAVKLGVVGHW